MSYTQEKLILLEHYPQTLEINFTCQILVKREIIKCFQAYFMITTFIYIFALIGSLLSLYTLYLHYKLSLESSYKAVCDLNNRFSCTATIKSDYGKIMGIPNGAYGIGFYLLLAILWKTQNFQYAQYLMLLGIVMTIYFAYQLFRLKTWCPVCISIYIINIILLILVFV